MTNLLNRCRPEDSPSLDRIAGLLVPYRPLSARNTRPAARAQEFHGEAAAATGKTGEVTSDVNIDPSCSPRE